MGKKSSYNIRGIGQLPNPKTVNVPSLIEDMWEVYRDTVGSLLTTVQNPANKPAEGCQSYVVNHVLSHRAT